MACVNNAGVGMQNIGSVLVGGRKLFEVETDTWRNAINANFNGPFMMAKAIAPRLIRARLGADRQHRDQFLHHDSGGLFALRSIEGSTLNTRVIWSKDLTGTGVSGNALLPGGPANTRMIPQGEVTDRTTLIQPEVMMAPIVWLMSPRSNGVNGRRIIAKEWDAERLQRESPDKVGSPPAGEAPRLIDRALRACATSQMISNISRVSHVQNPTPSLFR